MANFDIDAGWSYHNASKHSHYSVRANPHFLDWANQPLPFKTYQQLPLIPLPRNFQQTNSPVVKTLADVSQREMAVPDIAMLSQLLYFSAGITRRRSFPGGEIYFRAAACTGALYEIELYLVCGPLPDLEAGLYHFAADQLGLRRLRSGDFRRVLVDATDSEPAITHTPVIVISTGTYWRNAWKYQARTYRHFGWDNGTILANLLAVSASLELPSKVVCGFVDSEVNGLLALDENREVALSLVTIGSVRDSVPPLAERISPVAFDILPLSKREVDYPVMRAMHAASSLFSAAEVAEWRRPTIAGSRSEATDEFVPLKPLETAKLPREPIEQVILRRGSTRRFAREPISFEQFSTILDVASCGIAADFLEPFGVLLNDLYIVVHAVEGLASGAYFLNRARRGLELLKRGDFRSQAGDLGLEQQLPADASVAMFFLADLEQIFKRWGNRGYRAVQLEAGILGGRLYLAAYALDLGASGLTFYDDDVVGFFSPHAAGKNAVFLVAVGRSAKSGRITISSIPHYSR